MNTVIEETIFDVSCDDSPSAIKPTSTSNKRIRGQHRRHNLQVQSYHDKIATAINNNGIYRAQVMDAQNDGGANRTVTNNKNLLIHFESIPPYPINGVSSEAPAIHCTGKGYIPWRSNKGDIILVRSLYCAEASGAIISPNDVVTQYQQHYTGWNMTTNFDSRNGTLQLIARDDIHHLQFNAYEENKLWFHYIDIISQQEYTRMNYQAKAVVKTLSQGASYQLWHHRLGHASDKVMHEAHKHCKGVPKFNKPHFYQCNTCLSSTFKKKHIGKIIKRVPMPKSKPESIEVGQHLHADFGFVRGSDYSVKDKQGKLITSKDGYRSYCLVIDRKSRYIWIILTQTKEPPIRELQDLLTKLQANVTSKYKTITTDNGKELGASKTFQSMLLEPEIQYTLKTTGVHSSAQNGLAEKPNQDLGRMMRSLLYGSGLGSEYWSYALRHSVFLKNRLPHSALQWMTPYELINGSKPDLTHLRSFGSKVHFMHKLRTKKLDRMDRIGTFMTYKGTNKIGYVIDDTTKRERVATHMSFDEAHFSTNPKDHPPMAVALQHAGYRPEHEEKCDVKFNLINPHAKTPVLATEGSAAYDIHSVQSITIQPNQQVVLSTGLTMQIPTGYHGQLHVRSSYAVKYRARIEAGLIDSDYRGEIMVIMSNNGDDPINIVTGDRIAQLTIIKDPQCVTDTVETLDTTARNHGKFGSTGNSPLHSNPKTRRKSTTAAAATINGSDNDYYDISCIELSTNPFIDEVEIMMKRKGNHNTNGLLVEPSNTTDNRVIITECKAGTPAGKIKNWRSRMRNNVLLKINNMEIQCQHDVVQAISSTSKDDDITLTIGQMERVPMHDDKGVPMIYFDQLAAVSTHLQQIQQHNTSARLNPDETKPTTSSIINALSKLQPYISNLNAAITGILPKSKQPVKRLTRKKLKQQSDWDEWKLSEWQQLDQYYQQKMFGTPCTLPKGANVLSMIWAYTIKDCGRKKARMVCNGKPSNKNTAIFGYTYAKSLDHVGARIFWAVAAAKNYVVRGADAANAFAEADAPKIPLYVRLNDQYRE